MTRFYPVYVRRSDGKLDVPGKAGRLRDKNAPSADQLDRTPNSKGIADYYREITSDEVKHIDWRRKLAGMLVREIGGKEYEDKQMTTILESLPENYRLFEHIKSRPTDNDPAAQSKKNHAGGGHDRQDAYLYGHPLGPKKRFRSPADFFPHLLWLCTDPMGNTDNCSCKLCCPEEIEEKKPGSQQQAQTHAQIQPHPASTPLASGAATVKKEEPGSRGTSAPSRTAFVEIPKRAAPVPTSAPQKAPSVSPVTRPASAIVRGPDPSPLPPPRSIDQQTDTTSNQFHHRPGELVWFNRGQAWGLAVITSRYEARNQQQQSTPAYVLQPLSHPLSHPPPLVCDDSRIRPWLAWSPPPCTHRVLAESQTPPDYDQIDWQGFIQGKFGPGGDLEVDGSILAAKRTDNTFTFLEVLKRNDLPGGVEERRWNCLFLGGEKLWVGDPVRLRVIVENQMTVLVVLEIITRTQPNPSFGIQCQIVGDLYSFGSMESNQEVPYEQQLPARMRGDLRWRNSIAMQKGGKRSCWNLIRASTPISLTDVKGRWHEDAYLLPLLAADSLQQMYARGVIGEANRWLNGRNDSNNKGDSKDSGILAKQRIDAFGSAVPSGTQFRAGLDPPAPQGQRHQQGPEPASPKATGQGHDVTHGAIEEFMNLDDDIPGFGQAYGSQGHAQGFQF